MTSEYARGIAAQAWCTDETADRVMDADLCEAFANLLDRELARIQADGESGKGGHLMASSAERIALYGRYAVFAPYEFHDGPVQWTVQRVEPGDEPEDMGVWLAEFGDRFDAELFAEAKFESDEDARLDKLRDDCESEEII